jgi:DNA polymerase I-like protein with 3'-5' exonuclease and polymerase domains
MSIAPLDQAKLHLVSDLATLDECRRWLGQRRDVLCVDTESGGLSPENDRHRMTQLGDLFHGWAFPPGWFGAANEMITGYQGRLGMFNSPYDVRVLGVNDGVIPRWERIEDAQIMGHLADSIRRNDLKGRAAIEIDPRAAAGQDVLEEGMRKQHWTWDTVPWQWEPYWTYAALDPVLTAHLIARFSPEVLGRFPAVYDLELATCRIAAGEMTAGMMIDIPFIEGKITEITRFCEQAMSWLEGEFGITTVNSNAQVGAALNGAGIPTLVTTASGLPSIDKATLRLYRTMFPEHDYLLRTIGLCRKGDSIVNRYLRKFLAMADANGIIHYAIHTCQARTSRMSITDPPMQTYDRDEPVIRGAYIPRPGCVFVSIDADQIEARMTAHFSGDRQMIADFRAADEAKIGFFILMASRIYGETISKKDQRYTWTKNATYGQIYGSSLDTAARTAGVPIDQMRPAYTGFLQLYPGVGHLMNQIISQGRAGGRRPQVETLMGRRLYGDRGREYSLLNYKVQGSAAEVLKMGQVKLEAAGLGPYLRLPIHDEFLMEVPQELAADVLRTAEQVLTDRTSFAVPITWSGTVLKGRWEKT